MLLLATNPSLLFRNLIGQSSDRLLLNQTEKVCCSSRSGGEGGEGGGGMVPLKGSL